MNPHDETQLAMRHRDENIQAFFRGFEFPLRSAVAASPYLTWEQKRQVDAEICLRVAAVESFVRFLNVIA